MRLNKASAILLCESMDRARLQITAIGPSSSPYEAPARNQLRSRLGHGEQDDKSNGFGHNLTLDKLSISDIMSFRTGPLTNPPFQIPKITVNFIQHLDIAVVPFWQQVPPNPQPNGEDTLTDGERLLRTILPVINTSRSLDPLIFTDITLFRTSTRTL